jgi:hypothetical protein
MPEMDIYEQVEAESDRAAAKATFERMAAAHTGGDSATAVREALALVDHAGVTENGRVSAWLVLGKGYLAAGDYSQALQYLSLYLNSPRGQYHENRVGGLEAFLAAYNGHQLAIDDDIYDDE